MYTAVVVSDSLQVEHWQVLAIRKVLELRNVALDGILITETQRRSDPAGIRMLRIYEDKKYPLKPNPFQLLQLSKEFNGLKIYRTSDLEDNQLVDKAPWNLLLILGTPLLKSVPTPVTEWIGLKITFDFQHWGYAELLKRRGTINSYLIQYKNSWERGKVVLSSTSSVDKFSANLTRARVAWKSAFFMSRALAHPEQGPRSQLNALPPMQALVLVPIKLIGHALKLGWLKMLKTTTKERWMLFFKFEDQPSLEVHDFRPLHPVKGHFWADPFVIYRHDKYYVFFEDGLTRNKKGFISVLQLHPSGEYSDYQPIIERDYHMSYPFIFEWQGSLFMIPETSANGTIDLYECVDFPNNWQYKHTLMSDIVAYDTTLIHYEDRWWLFANVKEHKGISSWDELYIYYADDPLSQNWTPHPKNPVISDVTRARPAGRIMILDQQMIRPSQDSSWRYGYALKFSRITTLNEFDYQEVELSSVEAVQLGAAQTIHTYNHQDGLTLVDGIERN